ncbi:HET-domain-containing protein [Xylariaceae sp. AK1471]|nr:HET-domain-containing protein [Xylariaceae sp. AK1471]
MSQSRTDDALELDSDGWQIYDRGQWDPSKEAADGPSRIDSEWIDLNDIRQWIYTCNYGHDEICKSMALSDPHSSPEQALVHSEHTLHGRPLWLVDVEDECIVSAEAHRYVALSYVWGNVKGSETTRDTISILRQPGALRQQNEKARVPKTIRHTMQLIKLLGERYLWVDRFCICQDDAENKHSQLNLMGKIFEGAYFTIVAANGWDADHGLRGIKGVTEPRNLSSQLPEESGYLKLIDKRNTVWYSRGWTFQEMFFSTRRLVFLYNYVVWECSSEAWHESTGTTGSFPAMAGGLTVSNKAQLKDRLKTISSRQLRETPSTGVKSLLLYLHFISQYNSRAFTFPEDGLDAFLGITTQMMDHFPHGFLWGLPIAMFDIALLWQPAEDMVRRKSRRGDAPQLPSWSWVGWQGLVDPRCWDKGYEIKITPVCKFACIDDGVIKEIKPEHESPRSDPTTPWIKQPSPILSVHGPVVTCKIWKRGGVYNRYLYDHWLSGSNSVDASVPCGIMIMSASLYSTTQESDYELLALSSATSPLSNERSWNQVLVNYPCSPHLQENGLYDYYNVLWITRKDGVAYRRALGKISITAWASFSPKWQFLQLG